MNSIREQAAEAARASRVAQGLPPTIEDPAFLARVAADLSEFALSASSPAVSARREADSRESGSAGDSHNGSGHRQRPENGRPGFPLSDKQQPPTPPLEKEAPTAANGRRS